MTTVVEFLSYLHSLGIEIWAEDDRLRYSAPKGRLTDDLRAELAARKADILTFLRQADRTTRSVAPIPRVARDGPLPLSFAQQRLWFLDQLDPGTPTYNVCAAIHFTGPLDIPALEQSINAIMQRHEALRTTFATVGGQPVQVIHPALPLPLAIVELNASPPDAREEQARHLATEEARRPFDLSRGPLLRATLLRIEQDRHILVLTMHHIVSDGWSMGVLFRELAAFYAATTRQQPSPLPELAVQYADFAVWQRQWLQGEILETQLAYWKKQLSGSPAILQLPTDRPRPALQTFNGAREAFRLSAGLTRALKTLSRRAGVTLFMTLLAAFKTLLYRYTGQSDILVGSPIANRNREEIEPLIGFFANTQVLRTDLAGNPTFRELLGRVREVTLGAYAHQDVPFEKLMEELHPERTLSYTPLFQVMFILQNAPMPDVNLPGVTLSPQEIVTGTAKFDMVLNLGEVEGELDSWIEYNTDLFDATSIARFARHYETLLAGVVADPDQRLLELPLLTEAEQQHLLGAWSAGRTTQPPEACIHELFDIQAARTPDAVAFVCEGAQVTYRELACRANQLAHYLQAAGVGPEVLVAVCLERSLEMVVGMLGVLKAGAAYVPLDPAYPQERLAFMLEDSRAPILLTQQHLAARLPAHRAQVLCLDSDWEAITRESAEDAPRCSVTPDNPAYVIYTSGSTGRPKGVLGLHRGAINRFTWMWETYPFAPDDVCCQKTSLSFVDSIWEIFGPLLQGIRTVIIPDAAVKDPQRLVDTLAEHRVTRIVLVPSLLRVLLETFPDLQERLPRLQHWVTSGEALPLDLCQRFRQCLPQATLLNLYGSSEVSADATWYDTRAELTRPGIPIGRPIDNTQVYILDAHMRPVPVGVPGELYIGGYNLARGYLNRPDLTAARFVPNPFGAPERWSGEHGSATAPHPHTPLPGHPLTSSRLYRTGDMARYLPDGSIEFLGRIDQQVKLRGFRIELGEIEATLAQHPAVNQNVVVMREDTPGDKRLVAYVVVTTDHGPRTTDHGPQTAGSAASRQVAVGASELRDFLKARLPEYMLPAAFVFLDAMPLTPNGKVNRRALPVPEVERPELTATYLPPRTAVEQTIAAVWQEALHVAKVGVNDNFFDLGGHSLLMVQVHNRLRATLQSELQMIDLFKYPTVSALAAHISQSDGTDAAQAQDHERVEQLRAGRSRLKQQFQQRRRAGKPDNPAPEPITNGQAAEALPRDATPSPAIATIDPPPYGPRDGIADRVLRLFRPDADGLAAEYAIDARLTPLIQAFLQTSEVSSAIELDTLTRAFTDSRIPIEPGDVAAYLDYLADTVIAHSIHTASPRFIGHMTTALPSFVRPLARLLTALNQNVVKMETAKAFSLYERQAVAMIHRLIYACPEDFYTRHIQDSQSTLGNLVSGGTMANLTALWCARNLAFGPRAGFRGVEIEGLPAALRWYGYSGAVVIGSTAMHYSLDKAADLLGIGTHNLLKVPADQRNRIDLDALSRTIAECRARNQRILALVGIAGTTDAGGVDPLAELAAIARAEQLYLHVDAAWGGPLLFSERHRHKLAGIEQADSVTIDGHKQLYLPMGSGIIVLRDPHLAQVIEKQASYIVRTGSSDLGKRTVEGSRPGMALFLHAALTLLGRTGYEYLIDEGIRKAQWMAAAIRARPEFELLADPEINILVYRYVPAAWRARVAAGDVSEADNRAINAFNERLQKRQRQAGHTFISRTTLRTTRYGRAIGIVALRAVLANPLITEADIAAVLDDQLALAAGLTSFVDKG